MRIGELADRAGVTTKTVRYYESVGLVTAERLSNGYRDYSERDVRLVRQIRELRDLGVKVEQSRPFLECLLAGSAHGDDCPDSLSAYRAAVADLDTRIAELAGRRAAIVELLDRAAERSGCATCVAPGSAEDAAVFDRIDGKDQPWLSRA